MIEIEGLTVGPFQSNCFIVSCSETQEAMIFDAGDESARILEAVRRLGVRVTAIVNTHAHIDHVSGLSGVVESLGVPVLMHEADMPIYENVALHAAMFGLPAPATVPIDRFLGDGETLEIGNVRGEVLHTPGHSPGGISILFADESPPRIISGDVLFQGSIGRTDLPGADYGTIMATLRTRYLPLADDTIVYPGHGPETTMGAEKRTNPFVAPLVNM